MNMRFLADMGVSMRVVEWLRANGHDAVHLREEELHRLPNGEIFAKAKLEKRVVLTFDLDIGEIVAFSHGSPVPVIVFRLRNTRVAHVISRLAAVLAHCEVGLETASIIVVEETRHRIRHFPSGPD